MREIKKFLKTIFKPGVFVTFCNYVLKIVLNPIILIFIPIFLDEQTQGYWFTFKSVAALTTLADMGFTSIITLFAAHECAFLTLNLKEKTLKGDLDHCYRLSSLFRFLLLATLLIVTAATIIVFSVGFCLFSFRSDGVVWLPQWSIYVVATVVNFAVQLFLSFFEGCNQFLVTQRIRIVSSTIQCLVSILMLWRGYGLYSIGVSLLLGSAFAIVLLLKSFGPIIGEMIRYRNAVSVPWAKDILPLLGRYAISFISGTLAQQLYNPLAFSLKGSAVAGKVGYGLSIAQAVYSVAGVWNIISIPHYNMSVEKRDWKGMDRLLKRNLIYSGATFSLGMLAVIVLGNISFLKGIVWNRTLPIWSILILFGGYFVALMSNGLASYVRAHEQEPYVSVSLISGGLNIILTILFAKTVGVNYIFLGYLVSSLAILPRNVNIFKRFRDAQHDINQVKGDE